MAEKKERAKVPTRKDWNRAMQARAGRLAAAQAFLSHAEEAIEMSRHHPLRFVYRKMDKAKATIEAYINDWVTEDSYTEEELGLIVYHQRYIVDGVLYEASIPYEFSDVGGSRLFCRTGEPIHKEIGKWSEVGYWDSEGE